ncbi:AAA family ATPase [Pyxidicoccus xibeiensis]|uniref:AAA family ATPase n=1 Tax=Pyxidicoccus xibeiensis TaxID=2906759 RepID=UPI0020A73864|nr:MoxR family ATPase [Pyxidicoccus xibeiensis]MCP3143887.1 MoxR family ATPase [Pyxidicoccus xibeiensis]
MESSQLVASWLQGRATLGPDLELRLAPRTVSALAGKLRRAYTWISTQALVSPYQDVHFGDPVVLNGGGTRVELGPVGYSAYVLLPLLNLATSQRLLFVGAPGRGKTTMATLVALIAGGAPDEVRRGVQHGHPQLTLTDLLGSPLPSELIRAEDAKTIRVAWRRWLTQRVKIIDEYNRIPTKTQSALLSLMAEGYAEMFEQVVECGRSAWFLTANDDQGGGTFPVIEALKDRIDLVVRSMPFHSHHLDTLARRITEGTAPGQFVPADIVFTPEELDALDAEVRAVPLPAPVLELLGFFAGQLEFCQRASTQLEYMLKDTLHLAGRRVAHVCTEDCPLDKSVNLCTQTENGVSARAYQAVLLFSKALAYFRGSPEVTVEDLRQVLPWALHDKLKPNPQSAFFQKPEHAVYLLDKVGWVRQLFDAAVVQQAAYAKVREPVARLKAQAEVRTATLHAGEVRQRMGDIQRVMEQVLQKQELNGPVHEDLVFLKNLHGRYGAYLHNLERRGKAEGA